MSADQAIVGAQVWVSATTVSAPSAHRWGTQSDTSGAGTPNGLRTRSASDIAISAPVVSAASLNARGTRSRASPRGIGRLRGSLAGRGHAGARHARAFSATHPSRRASTASSVRDSTP